jgi:hypothetical protein
MGCKESPGGLGRPADLPRSRGETRPSSKSLGDYGTYAFDRYAGGHPLSDIRSTLARMSAPQTGAMAIAPDGDSPAVRGLRSAGGSARQIYGTIVGNQPVRPDTSIGKPHRPYALCNCRDQMATRAGGSK